MLRIRKVLLVVSLVVGMGSLSLSLAYGWYLRSDSYRQALEERVSDYLNLPVQIGSVKPLGLNSISAGQVRAHLPDRGEQIFECQRALWRAQPGDDERRYLELENGRLTIGSKSHTWHKPDYRRVLESSFGHDFADLKLQYVRLVDMDIDIVRPSWSLNIGEAGGQVIFATQPDTARAHLKARTLNGYRVAEPISVVADFAPGRDLTLHEVKLSVPRMPIRHLNLHTLVQSDISSGWFSGTLTYREGSSYTIDLKGVAQNLSLAELTESLPGGGVAGRLEHVTIDSARLTGGRLEHVTFSGRLVDMLLSDVGFMLELPPIDGCLNLQINSAMIEDDRIVGLSADGSIVDVDMGSLTAALGVGNIAGVLNVELRELTIADDEIIAAEIDVVVRHPTDGTPTISKTLIDEAARRFLNLELTNLPFEELEYVKLGVKFLIDSGTVRVGSPFEDPAGTILSVRLLGREVPVIRAPLMEFELDELLAALRAGAEKYEWGEKFRRLRSGG